MKTRTRTKITRKRAKENAVVRDSSNHNTGSYSYVSKNMLSKKESKLPLEISSSSKKSIIAPIIQKKQWFFSCNFCFIKDKAKDMGMYVHEKIRKQIIHNSKYIFLSIILLCSAVIFAQKLVEYEITAPNNITKPEIILIKKGISSYTISSLLKSKGIIKNQFVFLLYVKLNGIFLQAGEYEFLPGKNLRDIISILAKGETKIRKITIPEGFTVTKIIQLINNDESLSGAVEQTPPEGAIFPDTYYHKYGENRVNIIKKMQKTMDSILDTALKDKNIPELIDNKNKLLTIASMIQQESSDPAEMPIIASVFYNRLKVGMALQSDPTAIYALTDHGKNPPPKLLHRKDLLIDSPYNTYKYRGLPPGPISCPGFDAINAAIYPAKTKYLYFVVNGLGGHEFATNLSDHNKNVKKYKDNERQKLLRALNTK
ncbi:MAG: endolytic transglycosylase MltG [Rickettsiaceae bacterium]|nr:endolytic transglycosylase MltG [Rickettsiaceae bacterium]